MCNKKPKYQIFTTEVTRERFGAALSDLSGWQPTFNNLKSLYIKSGKKWEKTPIPDAKEIQKEEAWKDMPEDIIKKIKNWPEFDADMFFEITGLK
jgi:hypothetical protein